MKRLTAACALVMACVASVPAQAWGGHGGPGGWHGGPGGPGGWHGAPPMAYGGGWHRDWVGPVLGAAIVGGAIYAATAPRYVSAPVVMAPPPMPRVAYYCASWGQYYPAVQTCPMPWQLVNY